ncbi:MAG TPA: D-2-hydroxyacid dehydrogenase family protein [Candidatus Binatia bacterium]|nr:D-2-hydroxyacid dehydrogenase family protein [Candidatus Binatia bacterium]
MKITVIDDYQDAFRRMSSFPKLAGHEIKIFNDTLKEPARLAERLHDAECVVLTQQRSWFRRPLIEALPNLRLISQTGRVTAHIDLKACSEHGVMVCAGGKGRPHSTAELAWALILAALRHVPEEVTGLRQGRWQSTLGADIFGKSLGIYALGGIGSIVANIGRAFGARVLCWGRSASLERARSAGYEVAASREEFFAESDILSLHLPMVRETRGIVTRADLARMKPTALLVNTSRSKLIEANALVEALQAGRPGFAAVDVYDDEPIVDADHPLLKLDNAICTPHLGFVTAETYEIHYRLAVEQILAYVAGQPIHVANPEVLQRR